MESNTQIGHRSFINPTKITAFDLDVATRSFNILMDGGGTIGTEPAFFEDVCEALGVTPDMAVAASTMEEDMMLAGRLTAVVAVGLYTERFATPSEENVMFPDLALRLSSEFVMAVRQAGVVPPSDSMLDTGSSDYWSGRLANVLEGLKPSTTTDYIGGVRQRVAEWGKDATTADTGEQPDLTLAGTADTPAG